MSIKKYLEKEIKKIEKELDDYSLSYFKNEKLLKEIIEEKDIYESMFPNWKIVLENFRRETKEVIYIENLDDFLNKENKNKFEEISKETFNLVNELTEGVEPFEDGDILDYGNCKNEDFKLLKDEPFEFIEKLIERQKILERTLQLQKSNIDTLLSEVISLKTKLTWF